MVQTTLASETQMLQTLVKALLLSTRVDQHADHDAERHAETEDNVNEIHNELLLHLVYLTQLGHTSFGFSAVAQRGPPA